jgi:predicted Zn-dependent protease
MSPAIRKHAPKIALAIAIFCGGTAIVAIRARRSADLENALALVDAAVQARDYAGARKQLDRLAADFPKSAAVHLESGKLARETGEYNRAREEFLATLRIDPKNVAARASLVELTRGAGAVAESRHHLDELRALLGAGDPLVQRLETMK